MSENERYERQTILTEIGPAGQEKISKASVLFVGAGGLGCPALLYLAAAGAGRIGIVDFDVVEETNLQRQVLFTPDQIRRNKAKAAQERLEAFNPHIAIKSYPVELTEKNAEGLFNDYDIIIDGADNFATKFLINDAAVKCGKPFIYGSILGFEGQISVFNAPDGPCYRCLFPQAPKGHIPNCAEAGVIGAVAGIIGAMQAMETIKMIVEHKNLRPLIGKIWACDARSMESRIFSLAKNPNCSACSKLKNDISLEYSSPVCGSIPEITPLQACARENAVLIDVREKEEWDAGHIENAKLVPLSELRQGATIDFPKDVDIIIYCQKGKRGLTAATILRARGYLNVSNMQGGYEAWIAQERC